MRRGISSVGLAVFIGLVGAASCDEEVRRVQLELPTGGGFGCSMLAARIPQEGALSIVLDMFEVGGEECRVNELLETCDEAGCLPLESERSCIDLELPDPLPASVGEALGLISEQLQASDWERELPADGVVIRAVLLAATCDDVAARTSVPGSDLQRLAFDCTTLVGCGYACPLRRGDESQSALIVLDNAMDPDAPECIDATEICSRPRPQNGVSGCGDQ